MGIFERVESCSSVMKMLRSNVFEKFESYDNNGWKCWIWENGNYIVEVYTRVIFRE